MDTTARVQRWRQRRRDEGKEAMTIWLSHDTKLRLEDLAAVWRVTPSELIEQALTQFHPGNPPHLGNVTETLQLRETVAAVLAEVLPAQLQAALQDLQPVTVTNGNVAVPSHVETPPVAPPAEAYAADHGHSVLTEASAQRTEGSQARAYGEVPAAILATLAPHQSMTPAEIAQALGDGTKQGTKTVWQALQRLAKSGKVLKIGRFYRLAP